MQEKAEEYQTPPPNYSTKEHAINGFSSKPSVAQIASYVIIASSISIYFSSTITIENYPVLMTFYIIFGTLMIITSAISTIKDPTDRIVYYYKWSRFDKKIVFSPNYEKILFCEYCDSYCYGNSKHCRTCNRCVNNFDHHCMWFNNCVGERNYRYFLVSIISTFCYAVVLIIHVAIISFRIDFSNQSTLLRIILSWIIGFVLLIFGFLIMNLIILHIYLILTNQTTYQFLQKKKKLQESQEQQRRYQQRQQLKKKKAEDSIKEVSSDSSIANNKLIKVTNNQSKGQISLQRGNIFQSSNITNKVKNQDDFFQQQLSKHSKKEDFIKEMNYKNQQNDHDQTIHNSEPKAFSDEGQNGQRFPQFLIKNKSLKLLLSGSKAQRPSKRKLQAHEQQQSHG